MSFFTLQKARGAYIVPPPVSVCPINGDEEIVSRSSARYSTFAGRVIRPPVDRRGEGDLSLPNPIYSTIQ